MLAKYLKLDSKQFFLFGARWAFGSWLVYLGVSKWLGGASGFVAHIGAQFADTWSPAFLNSSLAWIILVAEPVIGLWLLLGKSQRLAWSAAAKLMFMLLFGMTLIQKFDVAANNWQYFVLCLACAALSESE